MNNKTDQNEQMQKIELYRSKIAQLTQEQKVHPHLKEELSIEKTQLEQQLEEALSKLPTDKKV